MISHIESSRSTMLVVQLARDSEVVGSFTVKNGSLTAEDTNGDGKTGGATRSTNSNLAIDSIEAYNFNKTTSGGVVQSSTNAPANITINNCNFHDNSAVDRGEAIAINSNSPNSVIMISNNKVTNNKVEGSSYSHGGGFYFDGMGELLISDNLIEGNKASVNNTMYDYYWSHGGGLSISNQASNSGLEVTLKNNQIKKNEAQLFGGGIYFMLTKSSGDVINLESGTFEENHSGYAGGAIDYSVHGQPTLVLKNALITQNKSPQGGGIWACPTARTMTYFTLGGSIIENELINDPKFSMTDHDIRFDGSDTRFPGLLESNNPAYHRMTIQDRTFLGDKINWYADEPGDLYEPGDPVLSPDYYTDRHTSFGLYGEIAENENWYQSHNSEARLIFINNTADGRGGAISTNVEVKLIRKDSNGGVYPLETIELSEANNWTYTFTNLPSKGLVNGNILNFTYEVEEVNGVPGFTVSYENLETEIIVTNTKDPDNSTPEPKYTTISGSKIWIGDNESNRPASDGWTIINELKPETPGPREVIFSKQNLGRQDLSGARIQLLKDGIVVRE